MLPKLTFVYDRRGRAGRNRPASVELRVYADGKQKYISTGINLLKKEWANGEVSACREDYVELNEQLALIKRRTTAIITRMVNEGCLNLDAIPEMLENEITRRETFIEYAKEIASRRYRRIAYGTRKHYEVFFRFLEEWGGIIFFTDIVERNILRMDDMLERRGLKTQTRWNYHKLMKFFINKAVEDGQIKKNPYTRIDIKKGSENGLTRYLTPEEFHDIETSVIPIERIARVRDLFVFQTYTMMSYADLKRFDYGKCTKENGEVVYKSRRQKTKQAFTVMLLRPALAILKRYDYKLPVISCEKYNEYLKVVAMYARIDKPISSHWARHTGATLMLNEGNVPIHVIQHILGHSSIRETERTYAKLLDRTIVESMGEYQRKRFAEVR